MDPQPRSPESAAPSPADGVDSLERDTPGQERTRAEDAGVSIPYQQSRAETEPVSRPDTERNALGRVGPYDLIQELARGGMGIVWKARHRTLGRVVALKTMRADADRHADHAERFNREMRAVARLSHPHIVPIFE